VKTKFRTLITIEDRVSFVNTNLYVPKTKKTAVETTLNLMETSTYFKINFQIFT